MANIVAIDPTNTPNPTMGYKALRIKRKGLERINASLERHRRKMRRARLGRCIIICMAIGIVLAGIATGFYASVAGTDAMMAAYQLGNMAELDHIATNIGNGGLVGILVAFAFMVCIIDVYQELKAKEIHELERVATLEDILQQRSDRLTSMEKELHNAELALARQMIQ